MLRTYPLEPSHCVPQVSFSRARTNHVTDAPEGAHRLPIWLIVATPSPLVGTYCPLDRMHTPNVFAGHKSQTASAEIASLSALCLLSAAISASALPYSKSFIYSFGFKGEDHGEAMGLSNDPRAAARIGSSSSSNPIPSSFLLVV